jgi:hypothetical protein
MGVVQQFYNEIQECLNIEFWYWGRSIRRFIEDGTYQVPTNTEIALILWVHYKAPRATKPVVKFKDIRISVRSNTYLTIKGGPYEYLDTSPPYTKEPNKEVGEYYYIPVVSKTHLRIDERYPHILLSGYYPHYSVDASLDLGLHFSCSRSA